MGIFSKTKTKSSKRINNVAEQPHIRDFIYLDIERIRSYTSQIYGGLTIEKTSKTEHSNTLEGSVTAALPLTFSTKAELKDLLLKSNTETKSLHDQIFDQFYRALLSTNSLYTIAEDSAEKWDKAMFTDGIFLSVKTAITITDYKYISNFTKRFKDFTAMIARTVSTGSNEIEKKQANANLKDIDKLPTKDLAGIIDEIYDDAIRIDFFPFKEEPDKLFIGFAERDLFRFSVKYLLTSYGATIDAGWNALIQVNRGEYPKNDVLIGQTGNSIDTAIKQYVSGISSFLQTAHTINFPAVSVTPIAIFRETSLG